MAGLHCYFNSAHLATLESKAALQTLELSKEESHHLINVLRATTREPIFALDGQGSKWSCQLLQPDKKNAILKVLKHSYTPSLQPRRILAQALPKIKIFEEIIRQSTEIGITDIYPILSARTEFKISSERNDNKQDRWNHITREACKQSNQVYFPTIHPVVPLKHFLKTISSSNSTSTLSLIASLEASAESLSSVFKNLQSKNFQTPIDTLTWLVGPEGDFTAEEYQSAYQAGYKPVRLSESVLRVETATLYALSVTDSYLQKIIPY